MSNWTIQLYENNYKKPVEKFIKSLQKPTIAKVIRSIEILETHGPNIGMPHTKQISTKLLELRIRGKQEVRIFYTFNNKTIYLLHGFIKKSQKTPQKEILKAKSLIDTI